MDNYELRITNYELRPVDLISKFNNPEGVTLLFWIYNPDNQECMIILDVIVETLHATSLQMKI